MNEAVFVNFGVISYVEETPLDDGAKWVHRVSIWPERTRLVAQSRSEIVRTDEVTESS